MAVEPKMLSGLVSMPFLRGGARKYRLPSPGEAEEGVKGERDGGVVVQIFGLDQLLQHVDHDETRTCLADALEDLLQPLSGQGREDEGDIGPVRPHLPEPGPHLVPLGLRAR